MADTVPIETLRQLLYYQPETGGLVWNPRPRELFNTYRGFRVWEERFAGTQAFTANLKGYRHGRIFRKAYLAHRVIWALVHGAWPKAEIDHINGNRADNRIENLREVNGSENHRNMKRLVTNTSGTTGVYWDKANNKWMVLIWHDGRSQFKGYFHSKDDAIAVRKLAEIKHDYHPNHGRVA